MGGQIQEHNPKRWLSQKSFPVREEPNRRDFGGYAFFISFSSLLPSHSSSSFFLSYLSKPRNSGLPGGRWQGSWKSSCEMMSKQTKPLQFYPIHSIFPINWKCGGDCLTEFRFLLLNQDCITQAMSLPKQPG